MVGLTFFVWDRKYPFWANLVQKIKILNLTSTFESRLIRICRIWCGFSFYSFIDWKYSFLGLFGPKMKVFQLKFVPRLLRICKIWWWCIFSFCFCKSYPKLYLAFWCYLIKLRAIFSQRLEASDFSCICYWNAFQHKYIRGDTHMTATLRGEGKGGR